MARTDHLNKRALRAMHFVPRDRGCESEFILGRFRITHRGDQSSNENPSRAPRSNVQQHGLGRFRRDLYNDFQCSPGYCVAASVTHLLDSPAVQPGQRGQHGSVHIGRGHLHGHKKIGTDRLRRLSFSLEQCPAISTTSTGSSSPVPSLSICKPGLHMASETHRITRGFATISFGPLPKS